ncbi:hypothetical protein [Nodosilinea nodulosa]|uniref:hypothetical protein n=1 Tax=Nodosilinea nodulosa TaxID=416001 RepID=UPI0012D7F663|nr:hypothetical protein [Nodosilinea nodulosa]
MSFRYGQNSRLGYPYKSSIRAWAGALMGKIFQAIAPGLLKLATAAGTAFFLSISAYRKPFSILAFGIIENHFRYSYSRAKFSFLYGFRQPKLLARFKKIR